MRTGRFFARGGDGTVRALEPIVVGGVDMRTRGGPFYVRWTIANGWAESAGLGATFVIGLSVAPYVDRHAGGTAILAGALLAVV